MGKPSPIALRNKSLQQSSNQYHEYLSHLGYAASSSRSRQLYVEKYLHWLEEQGIDHANEASINDAKKYYATINEKSSSTGMTLSAKTSYGIMKFIEQYYTMLQRKGEATINPVSTIVLNYPKENKERSILSQAQIQELYEACNTAQERAMLSLAYGCGMRVGELERIKISDVKLRENILIIPKGKGNKRRVVPMSLGVASDLTTYYFNERDSYKNGRDYKVDEEAFILNQRGGRMREHSYNRQLKQIINRTKDEAIINKEISIHSLRHSIASHLIEQGMKLDQVRQFLGHSQLETTQIYTHITKQQLKQMIHDST